MTVTYGEDGRPSYVERADDDETTRDWILGALVHGPRSVSSLADELFAELEVPAAGDTDRIRERLGRALHRMARDGWVEKVGSKGPGTQWALRERQ